MKKPLMFNARLNKDEIDIWLDLLKNASEFSYKDRDLAKAFLMLQESMTFISSLENKTIGGTSIFKDRTRLAIVLTSVVVDREFRQSAAYQIIKSSLPFFKTVAIRDMDALVSLKDHKNTLGFPLSLELNPWVADILKRIGFDEVNVLEHCSFEMDEVIKGSPLRWSKEARDEEVRELIWDQSKQMGLINSLVWLARDFAKSSNCLVTVSVEEKTAAVAGFWKLSDVLCVSPLVTDPLKLGWDQVAESIVIEAENNNAKLIELPLLGEGQQDLIQALEKRCCCSSRRKLSLLRKPL
jgi:hypothetical protein